MHWILQENIFNEQGYDQLINVLTTSDIPFSQHKVIPFIGEIQPDATPEGNVICFGSYSLRHLAVRKNWYPGVFDLEFHDFVIQKQHWGELMLNHDAVISSFADANIITDSFIRPIQDSKCFAGMIITPTSFTEWQSGMATIEDMGMSMTNDTIIQVCSLKNILSEYRFWVVDGKIVTKSLYKRGTKVIYSNIVDERFDDFVNKCIDIWQPLPAFVIDVCEMDDGQLKIVEINTINSSGFYAGEVDKIVFALEELYYIPAN